MPSSWTAARTSTTWKSGFRITSDEHEVLMFELRLMCPEASVETLSDALDALDALSVSVEDADAQTDAEQALFGEPGMPPPKEGWQRSRVIALFATEQLAREAAVVLAAQEFFADCRV